MGSKMGCHRRHPRTGLSPHRLMTPDRTQPQRLRRLLQAVPLMLGWGHGSELRNPLGVSIFGGLVMDGLKKESS